MEYNTKCQYCGKDIYKRKSDLRRYSFFFCDRNCRTEYARSRQPVVKCAACGKDIILCGSRKRNSKTGLFFCDNKCKNPYIARNSRWSGNPSCHRKRRARVIEQAAFKCQKCGYNEDIRMLDIHHHDEDHRNNQWGNLRCACSWCHQKHHRGVERLDLAPLFDGM